MRFNRNEWAAIALSGALASACSGSEDTLAIPPPTNTPPIQSGQLPNPASSFTVAVTKAGLALHSFRAAPGALATFANDDSVAHEFRSDVLDGALGVECPELNALPELAASAHAFVTLEKPTHDKMCGFHDQLNPTDSTLAGTIAIVVSNDDDATQ